MLDLNDICMTFHPGTVNERQALDHVSLHLNDGDFVCVLGNNGAGRARCSMRSAVLQNAGTIVLDGIDLSGGRNMCAAVIWGACFRIRCEGPHRT
ncbi:MAG: hypothetical protein ACLVJ6_10985 [Merdibacter sp.]